MGLSFPCISLAKTWGKVRYIIGAAIRRQVLHFGKISILPKRVGESCGFVKDEEDV